MLVIVVVSAAAALILLILIVTLGRRRFVDSERERFWHVAEITSAWSRQESARSPEGAPSDAVHTDEHKDEPSAGSPPATKADPDVDLHGADHDARRG